MNTTHPLLVRRRQGLYCPGGDFYVDPTRKVDRAVITHGHADHARPGNTHVLATAETIGVMHVRYGKKRTGQAQALPLGKPLQLNDVTVTLIPAGHCFGSAQVMIEANGRRAVVSGDFKRAADPTCPPFEPVETDIFVSEATFGLPIYRHPAIEREIGKLLTSLKIFPERRHLIGAYSLGKAQRLIKVLRQAGYDEVIYLSRAVRPLCDLYQQFGCGLGNLAEYETATPDDLLGRLAFIPPQSGSAGGQAADTPPVTVFASGWMRTSARRRNPSITLPLIISDHADWDELTQTFHDMNAGEIWITHGDEAALMDYAAVAGIHAKALTSVPFDNAAE